MARFLRGTRTSVAGVAALAATVAPMPSVWAGMPAVTTVFITGGLDDPILLTYAPGDHHRLFVAERAGRVRVIEDGVLLATPLLNLAGQVDTVVPHGLLCVAMHPDHVNNGLFYVNYTDLNGDSVIERYQVFEDDPNVADPASALTILTLDQLPNAIHLIEWIGFGPDGHLWLSSGNGGPPPCPVDAAQNLSHLFGKMLRIDVECDGFPEDPDRYYEIPADNPFVAVPGVRGEIWSYGLRQPWRCSFDRVTGDLYIGEVGGAAVEELNFQPVSSTGGENYGWGCMEGSICGPGAQCGPPGGTSCLCGDPALALPIHEYLHVDGTGYAIVGGYVYRGCAIPELDGMYIYADWGQNKYYALRHDGQQVTFFQDVTATLDPAGPLNIKKVGGWGEDSVGEIYALDYIDGEVFRIVSAGPVVEDCNGNGAEDACDIATGGSQDVTGDGVPDECTTCPWDLGGDGIVGITDLLALLAAWGTNPGGPPDFDGNGSVGITDLLDLLGNWGRCR